MGIDDRDGSDAPDYSLVEGFRKASAKQGGAP